jgi:hypothetical protein
VEPGAKETYIGFKDMTIVQIGLIISGAYQVVVGLKDAALNLINMRSL